MELHNKVTMDTNELNQILALYLGQVCIFTWLIDHRPMVAGDEYEGTIDYTKLMLHSDGEAKITPHLRRIESITEQEAQELYKVVYGRDFDSNIQADYWLTLYKSDLNSEMETIIGYPQGLLWLCRKGFDVFKLIDQKLAIEV
jgi:hypothetical protein